MIIKFNITTINKCVTYECNEKLMNKYNYNLKKDIEEKKSIFAQLHKCKKNEIEVKIIKDGEDVTLCYLS